MARIKKSKPKITAKKTTYSGSRDLILHPDLEAARRRRIASYKAEVAALKRANKILTNVETQDVPIFRQWFSESFLREYERIESLRQTYAELELLQRATEDYRLIVGGSYSHAFAKVSAAHEAGHLLEMMQDLTKKEEELPESDECENDFDDFFKTVFQEVFGMDEEPGKQDWKESTNSRQVSNEQLRNLYRQTARKLHPDFNPDQSAEEKALWHDLQIAYQYNDIDRLEEIHRRMNGQGAVGIDLWKIRFGDLVAMNVDIAMKLRDLNERIRREKKEDYWDFARRRNQKGFLNKISNKIRKALMYEAEALEMMIFETQVAIERWRAPRKPARSQPKKKLNKPRKPPQAKKKKQSRAATAEKDFWQQHFG